MTRLVDMFRVPEDESLEINERLICLGVIFQEALITSRIRAAVSGGLPVMIKLHMNHVHASRGIRGSANIVSRSENIESSVRRIHPIGMSSSAVYGVKFGRIVLIEEKSSPHTPYLNEGGYNLSVSVCYGARGAIRHPSRGSSRARRKPSLGFSVWNAIGLNAWIENAPALCRAP